MTTKVQSGTGIFPSPAPEGSTGLPWEFPQLATENALSESVPTTG